MVRLYKRAIQNLDADWPERYKDICDKVKAVSDWDSPNEASEELINRLIYDTDNGVSFVGQAFCAWPTPRPVVGKYREMLQHLKMGLGAKFPSDEVAKCRQEFKMITKRRGGGFDFQSHRVGISSWRGLTGDV